MNQRKQVGTVPRNDQAVDKIVPSLRRPQRWLLIVSAVALGLWCVFLLLVALRAM